jgi:hypothetical protein
MPAYLLLYTQTTLHVPNVLAKPGYHPLILVHPGLDTKTSARAERPHPTLSLAVGVRGMATVFVVGGSMAERHHRFLMLCSSFLTVYRLYICFESINVLLNNVIY